MARETDRPRRQTRAAADARSARRKRDRSRTARVEALECRTLLAVTLSGVVNYQLPADRYASGTARALPVIGAEVHVTATVGGMAFDEVKYTDANGKYAMNDLPNGNYAGVTFTQADSRHSPIGSNGSWRGKAFRTTCRG